MAFAMMLVVAGINRPLISFALPEGYLKLISSVGVYVGLGLFSVAVIPLIAVACVAIARVMLRYHIKRHS